MDDDDTIWLLLLAGEAAAMAATLAVRRRFVLESVGRRIGANAGWWAWGQGVPGKSQVVPLAFIHFGFTPEQLAYHIEAATHPEFDTLLRLRVMPMLQLAPQNTHLFDRLATDAEWYGSALYRNYYTNSGLDRQVASVRYFERDFFSSASYCRLAGRPPFSERDRTLLDLAMAGLPTIHVSATEAMPPEALSALTPRQRTVMLMLLDGQSRKQIATRLKISTHTVNEHVKHLYLRFEVSSIGELVARFMQSRA